MRISDWSSDVCSSDLLSKDLEEKLAAKSVGDLPKRLDGHRHARAYFGIIRLEMGGAAVNGDEQAEFIRAALDMETSVESAIAENSLNTANIEEAIRKALLPSRFGRHGSEERKRVVEGKGVSVRVAMSGGW